MKSASGFQAIKLIDYNANWSALEASDNPFVTVVMAHLKSRATANDPQSRYRWKMQLVRRLYERCYQRKDILELFRFIDWVLGLPPGLEKQFWDELEQYEEETKMPYVTSVERIGLEKGREQGREQGLEQGLASERRMLERMAKRRYGALVVEQVRALLERIGDLEKLEGIGELIIEYERSEDFISRLNNLLRED